jgi:uncharacterized membrane protein
MQEVIMLFFIYGFLGWIIDTGFRSFKENKFSQGSFLNLPFCSSYGFGGLSILAVEPFVNQQGIIWQFLSLAIVLSLLEFTLGFLSSKFWQKRFWDYSKNRFNLKGHTDLEHAIYWGGLGIIFLNIFQPWLLKILF